MLGGIRSRTFSASARRRSNATRLPVKDSSSINSSTALVRTRKLVRDPTTISKASRAASIAPDVLEAEPEVAQDPHALERVVGEAERLVVGLDHLHPPPLQRADRTQVGQRHRLDVPKLSGPGGLDHDLHRGAGERQVALAAEDGAAPEPRAQGEHPIARAIGRGFGREVAVGGFVPPGEQAVAAGRRTAPRPRSRARARPARGSARPAPESRAPLRAGPRARGSTRRPSGSAAGWPTTAGPSASRPRCRAGVRSRVNRAVAHGGGAGRRPAARGSPAAPPGSRAEAADRSGARPGTPPGPAGPRWRALARAQRAPAPEMAHASAHQPTAVPHRRAAAA